MSKDGIPRRKVLAGLGMVGVAAAGGGAGTAAYLSDSHDVTFDFTSGSIVLKSNETTVQFPQDEGTEAVSTIRVWNDGTLDGAELLLSGIPHDGSDELKRAAQVTTLKYRGTDILSDVQSAVSDTDSDGQLDLQDLHQHVQSSPIGLEGLVGGDGLQATKDDSATFTMGVTFNYSQITANSQNIKAHVTFTANQNVS